MDKAKNIASSGLTADKQIRLSEYQYFPPVNWFYGLLQQTHCIFFKYDEYRKMTFRNRCSIAGSNGLINLSVPILGGREIRGLTSDIIIDNRLPWQTNHWKSICSCYNHAPWFDEYRDDCRKIFETRFDQLTDLNRTVWEWLVNQLKLSITWEEGIVPQSVEYMNCLNAFTPKKLRALPAAFRYRQVFEERTGFLPHLSVLDLLFCTGPSAADMLVRAPSFIQRAG